ncbi:unnamed protein product [Calypogeia fissa]
MAELDRAGPLNCWKRILAEKPNRSYRGQKTRMWTGKAGPAAPALQGQQQLGVGGTFGQQKETSKARIVKEKSLLTNCLHCTVRGRPNGPARVRNRLLRVSRIQLYQISRRCNIPITETYIPDRCSMNNVVDDVNRRS